MSHVRPRLVEVIERHRHQYRAKDFFLHQAVALVDIESHRRFGEVARAETFAATGNGRALRGDQQQARVRRWLLEQGFI